MGIDYYIGEEQVRLTSAYHFNQFLNLVAEMGDFPQILDHSPIHGNYSLDESQGAELYKGSVFKLKAELEKLREMKLPEYAADIIEAMLEGVEISVREGKKITMDDGIWEGE